MSPQQLAILSDSPVVNVPGYGIETDRSMMTNALTAMFHAGLPKFAKVAGLPAPPGVEVHGSKWSCRFKHSARDVEVLYEGRWDDRAGRGFVERLSSWERRDGEPTRRWVTTFNTWAPVAPLNRWVARIREDRENGAVNRRATYIACEPVSDEELRGMTRIPTFDGTDSIRGSAKFTSYWDFRGGQERYFTRSADFTNDPTGLAIVEVKDPPAPRRLAALVRRTGWVAGTLLIVGLAALKVNSLIMARRTTRAAPARL